MIQTSRNIAVTGYIVYQASEKEKKLSTNFTTYHAILVVTLPP